MQLCEGKTSLRWGEGGGGGVTLNCLCGGKEEKKVSQSC